MKKIEKKGTTGKTFFLFLIAALLIRLFLMPLSAHSDILAINMFPSLFWTKGVVDIYSYVDKNIHQIRFQYYPPLTYFTYVLFQYFYQFFSSTFLNWMTQLTTLVATGKIEKDYMFYLLAPNPHILKDTFLMKVPYLFFETGILVVLLKLIKKRIILPPASFIWLFNPILLYNTYIFAQFDIVPIFFVFLCFLLLPKNPNIAILSLGIGIAYKTFPVIYAVPVALVYGSSISQKIKLLVLSVTPYAVALLPFLIINFKSGIISIIPRVFIIPREPLNGWASYSYYLHYLFLFLSLALLIALPFFIKIKNKWTFTLNLSLAITLVILVFSPRTSFHYLMWALPGVFLYFKKIKTLAIILLIEGTSFASYKLLDNSIQAGLFAPLNPLYFSSLPAINEIFNGIFPYRIVSTIGYIIFTVINIYLIVQIFIGIIFKEETLILKYNEK